MRSRLNQLSTSRLRRKVKKKLGSEFDVLNPNVPEKKNSSMNINNEGSTKFKRKISKKKKRLKLVSRICLTFEKNK